MIPVDSWNMSIELDYFALGKSGEYELIVQGILGGFRLGYIYYIYIYNLHIYGLYNYMVGVKYISYLTTTISDNKILVSLCLLGTLELCSYHEYKHEMLD